MSTTEDAGCPTRWTPDLEYIRGPEILNRQKMSTPRRCWCSGKKCPDYSPLARLLDRADELLLRHLAPPVDVEFLRHVVEFLLGARLEVLVAVLRRRSGPTLRAALLRGRAG